MMISKFLSQCEIFISKSRFPRHSLRNDSLEVENSLNLIRLMLQKTFNSLKSD